jgi:hypothetical protein
MQNPAELLRAVLEHPYEKDVCFLCACALNNANRSDEHVIPRWLQHEFNLWDQRLTLLNDTDIPYRQLTIPCCTRCNNETLAPLESRVRASIAAGFQALDQLPRFDLFRWLAKIYLGLQYRDLFLAYDRTSPDSGTILDPAFIRRYAILHYWLQLASSPNDPGFSPGSVWVYPAQVPPDADSQFDLKDDVVYGVIAMRIRGVALFADFLENGIHARIFPNIYTDFKTKPLHPIQFDELFARIMYGARRLRLQTKVEFFEVDEVLRTSFQWEPTTITGEVMDPWIGEDYAKVLAAVLGRSVETVYFPPKVMTFLLNPAGGSVFWELGKPFPFATPSLLAGPITTPSP